MEIIFTNHATIRMIEREISFDQIKETLNFPDYTIRKGTVIEAHKLFKSKNLKVVYSQTGKFIKIITLIWK